MKNVLLTIDCQRDFCPGGNLAVADGDKIIPVINKITKNNFDMVIATQDWHPENHISFASNHGKNPFDVVDVSYGKQMLWPNHCVQGTSGAEFHPGLDTKPIRFIIRKGMNKDIDSYSAFLENDHNTETGLFQLIPEGSDIYICGIATDVCVFYTALDTKKGFYSNVFVVEDACAGVTPEGSKKALEHMKEAGIKIISSDSLDF